MGVWDQASDLTHFVFFDPDPRADMKLNHRSATIYATGLWSGKVEKTLFLTANPEASSVFELNGQVLDDFLNAPLHKVMRKESIRLDAMSNVIKEKKPDFIKVDAEGADLEILKGAEPYLRESCLGVFVEVSFTERHKGAPFFGDTDAYLRSLDFMLMDLYPEHWIRSNDVFGLFSRAQVIWGNAIYFMKREAFLNRLKDEAPSARKALLAKFLIILLTYQAHDYAYEVVSHALDRKLISDQEAEEARRIIAAAMSIGIQNLLTALVGALLSTVGLFLFLPVAHLRRTNLSFLKTQLATLCGVVMQFAQHRSKGCISDSADPTTRL